MRPLFGKVFEKTKPLKDALGGSGQRKEVVIEKVNLIIITHRSTVELKHL